MGSALLREEQASRMVPRSLAWVNGATGLEENEGARTSWGRWRKDKNIVFSSVRVELNMLAELPGPRTGLCAKEVLDHYKCNSIQITNININV